HTTGRCHSAEADAIIVVTSSMTILPSPAPGKLFRDPVCGMEVDPARAAGRLERDGQMYYFCSQHCLEKFRADAGQGAGGGPGGPPHQTPHTRETGEYTCPMHPEVVQPGPGTCPICGMALEPRGVAVDEVNPELVSMTRRFWVSAVLTAPLLLSMAVGPLPAWVQLTLATPVVLWGGGPFFERGWQSVIHRSPNMFTLIAIGTGTSYLYSVAATLTPQIFPPSFRDHHGSVAVYYEVAAAITTLVLLGQVLE